MKKRKRETSIFPLRDLLVCKPVLAHRNSARPSQFVKFVLKTTVTAWREDKRVGCRDAERVTSFFFSFSALCYWVIFFFQFCESPKVRTNSLHRWSFSYGLVFGLSDQQVRKLKLTVTSYLAKTMELILVQKVLILYLILGVRS